jgi:hypothetical protein
MMNRYIVFNLIVITLLIACKKDHDEISLKGQWNVDNIVTKQYRGGVLSSTETEPGDGYKYDFKDDGNLVITGFLAGSTVPYTIISASEVNIDGGIFAIQNLTKSTVTLVGRVEFDTDYDEVYINLKR